MCNFIYILEEGCLELFLNMSKLTLLVLDALK